MAGIECFICGEDVGRDDILNSGLNRHIAHADSSRIGDMLSLIAANQDHGVQYMPVISYAVFETVLVRFFRYHPSYYRELFFKLKVLSRGCGDVFTDMYLAADSGFAFERERREVIMREDLKALIENACRSANADDGGRIQLIDMLLMHDKGETGKSQSSIGSLVPWFFVHHQGKADASIIGDWLDLEFEVPRR